MERKMMLALAKYEREKGVRILDYQQIDTRLFDLCVQGSGFFDEAKWVREHIDF